MWLILRRKYHRDRAVRPGSTPGSGRVSTSRFRCRSPLFRGRGGGGRFVSWARSVWSSWSVSGRPGDVLAAGGPVVPLAPPWCPQPLPGASTHAWLRRQHQVGIGRGGRLCSQLSVSLEVFQRLVKYSLFSVTITMSASAQVCWCASSSSPVLFERVAIWRAVSRPDRIFVLLVSEQPLLMPSTKLVYFQAEVIFVATFSSELIEELFRSTTIVFFSQISEAGPVCAPVCSNL